MTHGETVEHPWSENNQAGSSSSEMNPGHRKDFLDDIHSFWNWTKIQKLRESFLGYHVATIAKVFIAKYLSGRLINELVAKQKAIEAFEGISKAVNPNAQRKWEKMSLEPTQENGVWKSVYQNQLKKGLVSSRCTSF